MLPNHSWRICRQTLEMINLNKTVSLIGMEFHRSHKVGSLRSGEGQRRDYVCLLPHRSSPGCSPLSFCLFLEKVFGRLLCCLNA